MDDPEQSIPPDGHIIDHIPDFAPTDQQLPDEPSPELLHNGEREVQGMLEHRSLVTPHEGYQGALLARLTLPVDTDDRPAKQIGIMDYGDFPEDDPPYVGMFDGKPLKIFGKVTSRYSLVALNYTPQDHMRAYYPLHEGETVIGRQSATSHDLGLSADEPGNTTTSRQHATIVLTPDNRIIVKDHSMYGTGFETGLAESR